MFPKPFIVFVVIPVVVPVYHENWGQYTKFFLNLDLFGNGHNFSGTRIHKHDAMTIELML